MKRSLITALLLLTCTCTCTFTCTGCQVHDVTHCAGPATEIPTTYVHQKEGSETPNDWWTEFNSTGLNESVEKALARNLELQQAWDRLYQACAAATIAGSERFPQLDVSNRYLYTETHNSSNDITGIGTGGTTSLATGFSGTTNRYQLIPTLAYEVDLWNRIASQYRAAEWEAIATAEDVEATALFLSGAVTDIWLTIQEQLELLKVLRTQIEVSKTLLELVELRFAVGESSALDVYQQRLQLAGTEAELPRINAILDTSRHQLSVLMAEAPGSVLPNDSPEMLKNLPTFPELGTPMDLLNNRPDLRSDYRRLVSADYAVATAIADRFPKLTILLSYQFSATAIKDLFDQEFFSIITDLLTPIIDGGRRRAEVERRKAIVMEQWHQFSQTFLVALREVEDAIVTEKHLLDLLQKDREQIELATQNLGEARLRYATGLDDYLTVIAAVQSLQEVQRREVNNQKQLLVNRANLYRALGGYCLTGNRNS